MKSRLWAAGAVTAILVAVCGCSSTGTDSTAPDDTEASDGRADDVEVAVQCMRGDSLSSAPTDTSAIGFLEGAPDDTAWAQRTITVRNGSDSPARVDSEILIRYLDDTGSVISEEAFNDPFPPALAAAAGQTVNRSVIRFDVPDREGLVSDPEASARIYSSLGQCEVAGQPTIVPVADDEFIDADLSGQVELIECGLGNDQHTYLGTFRAQNPSSDPMNVELSFEIVTESGERLGIGGNTDDEVPAGGEATITGFAAGFTILDIDEAADCALLSAFIV